MRKQQKHWRVFTFLTISSLALIFAFNNCGSENMSGLKELGAQSPLQLEGMAEKTSYQPTPLFADSRLDWHFTSSGTDFNNAVNSLASQCSSRLTTFLSTNVVVPVIYDEGLLPGDPRINQMKPVKAGLDQVMNIAFCSYFAKTLAERDQATTAVINYIINWSKVYVGDGNPINDRFFADLIRAADLLLPKMTKSHYDQFAVMLRTMDSKEQAFMASLNANDGRRKNNWMLRHLMIRSYINIFLQNNTQLSAVKLALNNSIKSIFTAPSTFTLSSCSNLASIGAYGSHDLQERDAFVYHLSGLQEVIPFLRFYPSLIDSVSKAKILTAFEVTIPYVLSIKSHPEFKCTKVPYDLEKLALDPSLGLPWDPNKARLTYRYARLVYPQMSPWTQRFLTPEYHPWFKIFLAGKGDVASPSVYSSNGCSVQYPAGYNYSHSPIKQIYDLNRIRVNHPKAVSSTYSCRTDIPYIPVPFNPPRPQGSAAFNQSMQPANDYLYRLSTITDAYMQTPSGQGPVAQCALNWLHAWATRNILTELASAHLTPEGDYQRALINSGLLMKYAIIQKDPSLDPVKKAKVESWLKIVTTRVHDYSYVRQTHVGGVSLLLYWMGLNDLVGGLIFNNQTWVNRGVQIYSLGLNQIRADGLLQSDFNNSSTDFNKFIYALRPLVMMAEVGELYGLDLYKRNNSRLALSVTKAGQYFNNFSSFPGYADEVANSKPAFFYTTGSNQLDWMEIYYSRFATASLKNPLTQARLSNSGKIKNSRETSGNMTIAFGVKCL